MTTLRRIFGFALILSSMAGSALAVSPLAPEIDPGMAGGAITLVAGCLFILKDRVRSK